MTVNGSVITSGGTPRAGGGDHCRSAFMIPLRQAISRGQYFGPREGTPTASRIATHPACFETGQRC